MMFKQAQIAFISKMVSEHINILTKAKEKQLPVHVISKLKRSHIKLSDYVERISDEGVAVKNLKENLTIAKEILTKINCKGKN